MNLNIPDTRQHVLAQRLDDGLQIVAIEVAEEFDVSVDTIRRDILALEAAGKAHRVRGGAMPVTCPTSPLHVRLAAGGTIKPALVQATIEQIGAASTLLLDGGATTLALIDKLPRLDRRLVITPSPWIAIACQERDIDTFMLGGRLSAPGGMAVGDVAVGKTMGVAADIAVLGACGIEAEFGLSSDDFAEAQMKQAMHAAARRTIVVTDGAKLGRRARHHTLGLQQIDLIITDAEQNLTDPIARAGTNVVTVWSHN